MISFVIIFAFALLVEALWERIQDGIPERFRLPWVKVWGAVAISVAICLYFRVDLVAIILVLLAGLASDVGLEAGAAAGYTIGGAIITGFLISRGSEGVHKLIQMLFNIIDWAKANRRPMTTTDGIGSDAPMLPVDPDSDSGAEA